VRGVSRVLLVLPVLWCAAVRLVRLVRPVRGILEVRAWTAASTATAATARFRLRKRRARFHFFPMRHGFRCVAKNFEPRDGVVERRTPRQTARDPRRQVRVCEFRHGRQHVT